MNTKTIIILAALGGVALYLLKKKMAGVGVAGAAQALGGAAVDAANGAVSGVVKGVGGVFGVPDTDAEKCAAAKASGSTWDASFYCSAGDFLSTLWGSGGVQTREATGPARTAFEQAQASGNGSILDGGYWADNGGTFKGGGQSTDLFKLGIGF